MTLQQSNQTKHTWLYIAAAFLAVSFLWAYWPSLAFLWHIWMRSDEYSSGLLVPFLAVYIAWSRRKELAEIPWKVSLWGIALFLVTLALRYIGLFFYYHSAERLSMLLAIAAIIIFVAGPKVMMKISPVWLFLFLMMPLPKRLQAAIAVPLQDWATSSAAFLLEALGCHIIREGNVIHLGNVHVAVAEACNGLRMITAFFVISGLVILLIKQPLWKKIVLLVMTIPISLLCNTIRLTLTTMIFTVVSGDRWEKIFHDFGGYAMMPLALGMILGLLWMMKHLVYDSPEMKNIPAD